ncbi:MAG: AraC family transcriptional regulator [Victivallales bacterium]|nr:AraC family transcriptional regulator [Victivallales bacterium]
MRKTTREDYEVRLLKVQMYIQKHLDRELELSELARVACFSPFHFHRIFGAMVGESVKEYIRRLRLEMSAGMLFYTDLAISDIAARNGYDNSQSFSRAFRDHFGVPPRNYRRLRKNGEIHPPPDCHDYTCRLRRPEFPAIEVAVEELPERRVVFIRNVGPYGTSRRAWEKICSLRALRPHIKPGRLIGVGYDDPAVTSDDKIRYDACVEIDDGCSAFDGIGVQKLVGGKYAVVQHFGPAEGLYEVFQYLYGQWLPDSGYRLRSTPPYVIHYNWPPSSESKNIHAAVCLPVE